jgi:hypothetical protein
MLNQPPDDNLPEYVTPKEAMLAFEAGRDVALDGTLRTWPSFNLHALKKDDPEVYWRLVDFGMQIETLTQLVRVEFVLGILEEFVNLLHKVAADQNSHGGKA